MGMGSIGFLGRFRFGWMGRGISADGRPTGGRMQEAGGWEGI